MQPHPGEPVGEWHINPRHRHLGMRNLMRPTAKSPMPTPPHKLGHPALRPGLESVVVIKIGTASLFVTRIGMASLFVSLHLMIFEPKNKTSNFD